MEKNTDKLPLDLDDVLAGGVLRARELFQGSVGLSEEVGSGGGEALTLLEWGENWFVDWVCAG